jgi:hypothetical protein
MCQTQLIRGLALGVERTDRRHSRAGAQRAEQLDDEAGTVREPHGDDRLARHRTVDPFGELGVGEDPVVADHGRAIGEAHGVAQGERGQVDVRNGRQRPRADRA